LQSFKMLDKREPSNARIDKGFKRSTEETVTFVYYNR